MNRLKQLLYLLGIGFCFAFFFVGSLLLSSYLVLLWILPMAATRRHYYARQSVGYCFKALVRIIDILGVASIEFDTQLYRQDVSGAMIIANHPTLIDVVILISLYPQTNCVVKGSLWRHPVMALIVRTCGYIPNHHDAEVLSYCAAALERGEPLIIFPEGSRTTYGIPHQLTRGAANIALFCNASIKTLTIHVNVPFLTKEVAWYRVPEKKPIIRLQGHGDWPSERYNNLMRPKAARRLTADWADFFRRETNNDR